MSEIVTFPRLRYTPEELAYWLLTTENAVLCRRASLTTQQQRSIADQMADCAQRLRDLIEHDTPRPAA